MSSPPDVVPDFASVLAVVDDPLAELRRWYDEAVQAKIPQPDAMGLATATRDGRPSLRIVLFKPGLRDIRFFTNYGSRKAAELEENPYVAATFHWEPLGKQVRIEGRVTRLSESDNDAYWASRPRDSQLGAWASRQSQPIDSMDTLRERVAEQTARYGSGPVPRPPFWGGYRIDPSCIEFWLARPYRLHERMRYERDAAGAPWQVVRLSP